MRPMLKMSAAYMITAVALMILTGERPVGCIDSIVNKNVNEENQGSGRGNRKRAQGKG